MPSQALIRYAGYWPLVPTPWVALVTTAALSLGLWYGVETMVGRFTHPAYADMIRAAHAMQAAMQVARAQRAGLGLMQPPALDPNRTGLIGSEFTDTTTSLGDPGAKRTATNPDFAAALARRIADLGLPPDSPVMLVLSGSFIGANIAAIIAVEVMGLTPVVVSSLGASMYGATDPQLTWLDIEAELRRKGVIKTKSIAAVIGGGSATGGGMSEDGIAALRAAAARNGVPLIEKAALGQLLDEIQERVNVRGGRNPLLLINSGGSVAALGSCSDGHLVPNFVINRALPCGDGEPGLIVRTAAKGIPVLHLLNLRGLAADWGLPFDPVPLPLVGNNHSVYGMPSGQDATGADCTVARTRRCLREG